ncbi:MAG: homoserine kinase [Candidatus Korarchaeum sp.]|nr:homoserine kinase [Candidatus Korarchaeum sp.]MDW8036083.1 homoserine kinase [Candidatus Korarchaeum sp.]
MRAYCSSANLGPGYDLMGIALNAFHDVVEVELVSGSGKAKVVEARGPYSSSIPLGEVNSAAGAARATLKMAEQRLDALIRIWKGVPPRRGLGSSGASAAATVKAVNEMLGSPLSEEDLVRAASEGERIASGSPHADNVAPSLLGGLVVLGSKIFRFKPDFKFLLLIPWVEVPENKTQYMRSVIPREVPFDKFLKHYSHLANLLLGLALGDAKLFGEGMSYSFIDEVRTKFVPRISELIEEAIKLGALGTSLSGAGPTVLMLCEECEKILRRIRSRCKELGLPVTVLRAMPAEGASPL